MKHLALVKLVQSQSSVFTRAHGAELMVLRTERANLQALAIDSARQSTAARAELGVQLSVLRGQVDRGGSDAEEARRIAS